MLKWMNTLKGMLITCEIFAILASLWMSTLFNNRVTYDNPGLIGGYQGSYIEVTAQSEVCVSAVSNMGDFEVDTPSGKLVGTDFIGDYVYAKGCFAPGTWKLVKNPPLMRLNSTSDLKAISYVPMRVKYGTPVAMFVVSNLMLGLIGLMLWSQLSRRRDK